MPRVTVQVRDAAGNTATATADYSLSQPVLAATTSPAAPTRPPTWPAATSGR